MMVERGGDAHGGVGEVGSEVGRPGVIPARRGLVAHVGGAAVAITAS